MAGKKASKRSQGLFAQRRNTKPKAKGLLSQHQKAAKRVKHVPPRVDGRTDVVQRNDLGVIPRAPTAEAVHAHYARATKLAADQEVSFTPKQLDVIRTMADFFISSQDDENIDLEACEEIVKKLGGQTPVEKPSLLPEQYTIECAVTGKLPTLNGCGECVACEVATGIRVSLRTLRKLARRHNGSAVEVEVLERVEEIEKYVGSTAIANDRTAAQARKEVFF